ncbi:hypothetical protein GOODEAATRI_000631, partial [Goodea atripinnis]
VFRVASVCLGSPPDTICWEYRDKDKNFHRMGPITPQEFYREHVKPLYNIQDKVCLVNDPRPQNPYEKLYSVEFLGNMVGGRSTLYNNQPIQLLKKAAADSIKDGEAVWFGCDVGKHFHSKLGINDMNVFSHLSCGSLQLLHSFLAAFMNMTALLPWPISLAGRPSLGSTTSLCLDCL